MAKARMELHSEANIYSFIRTHRFLLESIRELLPSAKRDDLIRRTQYRIVDDQDIESSNEISESSNEF